MRRPTDKRSENAAAFAQRMNKVLDYIDSHLTQDLRLENLATLAAFSPFHFHRVFRAWTGETLQDFVRHRRLETAGGRLRFNRQLSITEVALGCGFQSGESFARAFGTYFGMTATAWRNGGFETWEARQRNGRLLVAAGHCAGEVVLRELAELEVVYQRFRGEYRRIVPDAWTQFDTWAATAGLAGLPRYGMGLDDPTITPAERCRYDACVEYSAALRPQSLRASTKLIAGGHYACIRYRGPRADMGAGWRQLLAVWLPESGLAIGDSPFVEAYGRDYASHAGREIDVELRMPVNPGRTTTA